MLFELLKNDGNTGDCPTLIKIHKNSYLRLRPTESPLPEILIFS